MAENDPDGVRFCINPKTTGGVCNMLRILLEGFWIYYKVLLCCCFFCLFVLDEMIWKCSLELSISCPGILKRLQVSEPVYRNAPVDGLGRVTSWENIKFPIRLFCYFTQVFSQLSSFVISHCLFL